jgi:hypothetical protein
METRHRAWHRSTNWARLPSRSYVVAASSALVLGCYLYSDWHRRNPYGSRVFEGVDLSQLLPTADLRITRIAVGIGMGLETLGRALLSLAKDVWNDKLRSAMPDDILYLKIIPLKSTPKG